MLIIGKIFSQETVIDSSLVKKPLHALRLSLIPGLGQIYNEKYFKTALIWGANYYLINKYINNRKFENGKQYCSQYTNLNQNGCRVRNRNIYAWSIVGIYLFQLIDAYVDAHLSSFPTEIKKEN